MDALFETLLSYERKIHERLRDHGHALSLPLATNLTFIALAGDDPKLAALLDAKLLLDLRSMVEEGAMHQ